MVVNRFVLKCNFSSPCRLIDVRLSSSSWLRRSATPRRRCSGRREEKQVSCRRRRHPARFSFPATTIKRAARRQTKAKAKRLCALGRQPRIALAVRTQYNSMFFFHSIIIPPCCLRFVYAATHTILSLHSPGCLPFEMEIHYRFPMRIRSPPPTVA